MIDVLCPINGLAKSKRVVGELPLMNDETDIVSSLRSVCRTTRSLFHLSAILVCIQDSSGRSFEVLEADNPEDWVVNSSIIVNLEQSNSFVVEDTEKYSGLAVLHEATSTAIRFIAKASLGDDARGAFLLFDLVPRVWSAQDAARFRDIVAIATKLLCLQNAAQDLARQERHFRILAETSTDTIVRGNLDGIRLYISPSVRELLGYEPESLVGRRAIDITHPDDAERMGTLLTQIREGTMSVGSTEIRQRHADGSWVWMEASVRLTYDDTTSLPDGYVASVRAIGRRKAAEEQLNYLASHDDLTGLPNRKFFRLNLEKAIADLDRGLNFALLWIDIDQFKQINDGLGHLAGDELLRQAAHLFRITAHDKAIVSRLGGDEFAIIYPLSCGQREAEECAVSLLSAFESPISLRGDKVAVGISIGIACAPESGTTADQLLSAADNALYRAKTAGRNTFRMEGSGTKDC